MRASETWFPPVSVSPHPTKDYTFPVQFWLQFLYQAVTLFGTPATWLIFFQLSRLNLPCLLRKPALNAPGWAKCPFLCTFSLSKLIIVASEIVSLWNSLSIRPFSKEWVSLSQGLPQSWHIMWHLENAFCRMSCNLGRAFNKPTSYSLLAIWSKAKSFNKNSFNSDQFEQQFDCFYTLYLDLVFW